jgi:hypothetical protein
MKKIAFPPMNAEQEAKLKRLLDLMGTFLKVEIKIDTMIIMAAEVPEGRNDVENLLVRISNMLKMQKP